MVGLKYLALSALIVLTASQGWAAKFANQFVEFELPAKWQCTLEGAEWVCQNTEPAKKRDAIIILAAKLRGDQDSLDQYLDYLKKPKHWTSIEGKNVQSEVKYAKTLDLSSQAWVDSLHLESEIPGFYTRYLATVKQDIGVLVTYSIHKDKYTEYLSDFDGMVKTLKVFRKAGGLNAAPSTQNLFNTAQIPSGLSQGTIFPDAAPQGASDDAPKKKKSDDDLMFILIVAGLAAVGLFIIKKKRGG